MKKWKHLLKAVMAVGVIAMTAVQICTAAEGTAQAAVSEVTPVSISTNEISGWPAGPEITSETGVLMDADSGTLLYSKGGDEIRYPASITKIMTLLLAVENCSLKEDVVFTETGTRDISWDSGNIGMQVGEVMSMRACLYALVIRSANEVAAQIAEHVGGTEQHFVDMMNERAAQIGCTNTHFVNASGLPDPDHYSTAHDMALIAQAAYQNETFLLYYGNKKGTRLVKEKVNVRYSSSVSREKALVEQLIKGPDSDNESAVLPEGTKVLSVSVKDHICYVNLDAGFLDTTNVMNPEVPVYAIVNSIVDGSAISRVQILIDGKTDITYMGKINLEKPLSRNPNIVEGE